MMRECALSFALSLVFLFLSVSLFYTRNKARGIFVKGNCLKSLFRGKCA